MTITIIIIVFMLIVSCTSQPDQKEEAKDILDKYANHLENYDELSQDLVKVSADFDALPNTVEGANQGLELIEDAEKIYEEQTEELEEAQEEVKEIKELDVSDEFKEFADMQIEIVEIYLEIVDTADNGLKELENKTIQIAEGTATEESIKILNNKILNYTNKVEELTEDVPGARLFRELEDEADEYFKDNDLGD